MPRQAPWSYQDRVETDLAARVGAVRGLKIQGGTGDAPLLPGADRLGRIVQPRAP